jgi:putative phage-type endonuclease
VGFTLEELEERRSFIGASEAAMVLGLSPYGGPLDVYLAKVHPPLPPSELEALPIVMGNALEPAILARYTAVTGRRASKAERRRHPKYPFIAATPDGIVEGEKRLVECKYVGGRAARALREDGSPLWSDEVFPDHYFVQVHMQMEVFDYEVNDLSAFVDHEFHIYEVRRDRELAQMWLEQLVDFWVNHVQRRDPPPARDTEEARRFLARRYPTSNGRMLLATPDDVDLGRQIVFAGSRLKNAEEEHEALVTAMKARVQDADGIEGVCTFKNDRQGRVAWKSVAEALEPPAELVAKHTGPPQRRFLLKLKE